MKNSILSGKFAGRYVWAHPQNGYFVPFVTDEDKGGSVISVISKENVKAVNLLNQYSTDEISSVGIKEHECRVYKITWKDGQESIAKTTNSIYEYVLFASTQEVAIDTKKLESASRKNRTLTSLVTIACIFVFVALIFFLKACHL